MRDLFAGHDHIADQPCEIAASLSRYRALFLDDELDQTFAHIVSPPLFQNCKPSILPTFRFALYDYLSRILLTMPFLQDINHIDEVMRSDMQSWEMHDARRPFPTARHVKLTAHEII
jgi:hypothetical protein